MNDVITRQLGRKRSTARHISLVRGDVDGLILGRLGFVRVLLAKKSVLILLDAYFGFWAIYAHIENANACFKLSDVRISLC